MIEIFLDGAQLEVPQDISIGLSLGIADYNDPVTASGAYTQTVEIPRTPHNDKTFSFSGEILSAEQFNHEEHSARIVQDGCELVSGKAYLDSVTQSAYNLQIVGEEIEWVAKMRDKKISELDGENIGYYMPDDWGELGDATAEEMPKLSWVLLQHGCWFQEADDKKIRRSWVTYNDLVPIVKLRTLLDHIFAHYEIVTSDSINELLHRTYTTMKWKEIEKASVISEDMGFEITSELKNANSNGELVVDMSDNNPLPVLSLFDTIVEDKGGVLSTASDSEGISIEFDPKMDCTASFELKTKYQTSTAYPTTAFQDKDGGWDDVAIGEPSFASKIFFPIDTFPFVEYNVKDSVEWINKVELKRSDDYKKIYTRHTDSDFNQKLSPSNMPLCYVEIDNPSKYESIGYIYLYYYSARSGVTDDVIRKAYRPTRVALADNMLVRTNMGAWQNRDYTIGICPALRGKDGKLYAYERINSDFGDDATNDVRVWGLSEDQRLTFEVALKTPPQRYTKGFYWEISRFAFGTDVVRDGIKIYGSAGGSLKPNFGWGVPIRESVKLSDLGGDTTSESMLRSIMQLYNLLIYTNPKTKQVYVHSFADFWLNNNIVDWSNRIDEDSDHTITYIGDSIGKEILLSFAEGSPRIDYYNERHKLPYSAYKKPLPNKMTNEAKEVQNEILTPPYMVSIREEFGEREGFIPAVALKDKEGDVLEFNLVEVPNTLMLIDTSNEGTNSMPPLNTSVFGDIGVIQPSIVSTFGNTTLSFSDKDGVKGLHQYYDKQIALWEKGKRLTCYCRVEAWEIEALRYNSENINFRSLFHLNINGEDIYARLESIEYEPSNTTNKCTFIIE